MISICGYSAVSQRKVTRLILLPFARSRLARLAGEGSEREAARLVSQEIAFVLKGKKGRKKARIEARGVLMARARDIGRGCRNSTVPLGTRALITSGKWHAPYRYSVS